MRIDFNVLWVDDQPDRVSAQIKAIAKQMEEEGFSFQPKLCQSIDEVHKSLAVDVFTDEVDLILVDWDLGKGVRGQDVIAEIRAKVQYKDVVFYSAQTAPDELRKLAFDAGLEGIYCAARSGLVDEVVGVFESLVKKVLDLDHTRGIVMGATSDIDHMVSACLAHIHDKLDQAAKKQMISEALQRIDERIKDLTKRATKLQAATTISELCEAHIIFTANDRLRALSRALEMEDLKIHSGAKEAVAAYMKHVVPDRNILGHQVLVPEGKPQVLIDGNGKQMNVHETRELRRLILTLRSDFRALLAALSASA